MAQLGKGIAGTKASGFEAGLQQLGELLGLEAVRPDDSADPDAAWRLGDTVWVLFEAKTEEKPDNALSAASVRQADSHDQWVRSQLGWEEPERVIKVLIADKLEIDNDARKVARDVGLVSPDVVRDIATRAIDAVRAVRAQGRGSGDEEIAGMLASEFRTRRLDTERLLRDLTGAPVRNTTRGR